MAATQPAQVFATAVDAVVNGAGDHAAQQQGGATGRLAMENVIRITPVVVDAKFCRQLARSPSECAQLTSLRAEKTLACEVAPLRG